MGPLFIDVLHLSPSLPLSRFLHPLPVARVFSPPSCYHFSALSAIIKAPRISNHQGRNSETMFHVMWLQKNLNGELGVRVSGIKGGKNSLSVKFLNIAFQMQVGFVSNHKCPPKYSTRHSFLFSIFFFFKFPESLSEVRWL